LVQDYPGRPVQEEIILVDSCGAGEDNGGRLGGRQPNQTNGPPTPITSPSFLQAGCTSCRPTNSVKALKVNTETHRKEQIFWVFIQGLLSHEYYYEIN